MAAFDARGGKKVIQLPVPFVQRSFGLDIGQPTGKAAILRLIGGLLNFHRFHRVDRNLNRETSGYGIDGLRRINQQHALILSDAFNVYFPVRGPNDSRHKRQSRQELLLHQRQRPKLPCAERGGWCCGFERDGGRLLLYLHPLADDYLAGQDHLDKWRLSFGDPDILLNQRLISERCASQIIAPRGQPREFKSAVFPGCLGSPFFGQPGTGERAGRPCNRSVLVSQHLALEDMGWRYRSTKVECNLKENCYAKDRNCALAFIVSWHQLLLDAQLSWA